MADWKEPPEWAELRARMFDDTPEEDSHHLEPADRARLERALEAYEGLCDALRDVLANGWPSVDSLEEAPEVRDWRLGTRTVPCLEGVSANHPDLPDGDPVRTSPLALLSVEHGVARTESRWYRLGDRGRQEDLPEVARRVWLG